MRFDLFIIRVITNKIFLSEFLVLATLLYVRSRFLVVELSFRNQELRIETMNLENPQRIFLLELSTLKTPEIIKNKAKHFKLEYNPPNSKSVYVDQ